MIDPEQADTRLIGIGSLPVRALRLYECVEGGRRRSRETRRRGAVIAHARRGKEAARALGSPSSLREAENYDSLA